MGSFICTLSVQHVFALPPWIDVSCLVGAWVVVGLSLHGGGGESGGVNNRMRAEMPQACTGSIHTGRCLSALR